MSIAVLKRKTLNGNPRLAPISGSDNGNFGFSLNGTRRGNYQHKDPSVLTKSVNCQTVGRLPSKGRGRKAGGGEDCQCNFYEDKNVSATNTTLTLLV